MGLFIIFYILILFCCLGGLWWHYLVSQLLSDFIFQSLWKQGKILSSYRQQHLTGEQKIYLEFSFQRKFSEKLHFQLSLYLKVCYGYYMSYSVITFTKFWLNQLLSLYPNIIWAQCVKGKPANFLASENQVFNAFRSSSIFK